MAASKFAEKNFAEFVDGDSDIIGDRFFDYLCNHATIRKYRVNQREEYRMDLIADNIWGNKNLYWILRRLNAILCITELSAGAVIDYIDMPDLESAYMHWKSVK